MSYDLVEAESGGLALRDTFLVIFSCGRTGTAIAQSFTLAHRSTASEEPKIPVLASAS